MPTARHQEVRDLNLVDLLLLQHQQQRELLAELRTAAGERGAISFQRLARMIAVHEFAEEIVLYPVVRANLDDGHRLAHLGTSQEDAIKNAVADLQACDLTQPHHLSTYASRNRLREIEAMIHAHHELEERQLIATLPQFEDAAALGGLASAFQMVAHLAPTRGHRHTPSGPLSNLLLATPVGVLDKLRDRMRHNHWR